VTEPSLDRIIEQLQFCIADARALHLEMLERLLSIALLEAIENKDKSMNERTQLARGASPFCSHETRRKHDSSVSD